MSQIRGNTFDSIFVDEVTDIDLSQFTTMDFSPIVGSMGYNTTTMSPTVYTGSQWVVTSSDDTTNHSIDFDISFGTTLKDFEDKMPDMYKIKEMCDMYPGFKKAFEHLRTIYNLIHDDYQEREIDL